MVAVVQAYIFHRKEVSVDINMQQFSDAINWIKLQNAYNTAVNWFNNNKGSVNLV